MSAFLTVAIVHLLAVMSPGPDFAIITRNSLVYSRRTGMYTAIGLGFGMLLHTTYCLLGIGLIISNSIVVFTTIKWVGALYLIWIGWKSLTAKHVPTSDTVEEKEQDISILQALRNGFLCNALNPKATLFVLALFTQVIDPATPLMVQAGYGIYMGVATALWFVLVASIFSLAPIKRVFRRIQTVVERAMGVVLIALGIKIALDE